MSFPGGYEARECGLLGLEVGDDALADQGTHIEDLVILDGIEGLRAETAAIDEADGAEDGKVLGGAGLVELEKIGKGADGALAIVEGQEKADAVFRRRGPGSARRRG